MSKELKEMKLNPILSEKNKIWRQHVLSAYYLAKRCAVMVYLGQLWQQQCDVHYHHPPPLLHCVDEEIKTEKK